MAGWIKVLLSTMPYLVINLYAGLVTAWMGDRLRVDKLSRYVSSHPGQLRLAIPPWVGAMSTSLGWEDNRRSDVALAVRHRQ